MNTKIDDLPLIMDIPLVPKLQLGNPVVEAPASRLLSPQRSTTMPRSRYRVQCDPCPHFLT
ncbi:MAG: hypothetical protein QX203_18570, partial [Methylococcaceae bacterium]